MFLLDTFSKLCGRSSATVLAFHKVPQQDDALFPQELTLDSFQRILDELLDFVRVLPLGELVAGLAVGRVPSNAVAITFDDGYDGWMHGVVPLLRARGVPATFFITTDQLLGEPLWHERIAHVVASTTQLHLQVGPHRLALRSAVERQKAAALIVHELKYQSLAERMGNVRALEAQAAVSPVGLPRLEVGQLRDMHAAGFEIGAHTVHHPILTCLGEQEAFDEIGRSREVLQGMLGDPVPFFAYPNGRAGLDFAPIHVEMVRRLGFKAAVTTDPGVLNSRTSPLEIPRFSPWATSSLRLRLQLMRNQVVSGRGPHAAG